MSLQTLWFVLIAVLWLGYLFLEGFDLGVGMHMRGLARDESDRRVLLNAIGPVWDGNEVWLITAGGAMFAAFPMWYASLFSALYVPLTLVLLGLILRAVSIEYRGKIDSDTWRSRWTTAMAAGSLIAAFGVGAALALTTLGMRIDAYGNIDGSAFSWLNWRAFLGGFAVVGFALVHGAMFLSLKTEGEIRIRARRYATIWLPFLTLPLVVWVVLVQLDNGKHWTWIPIAGAVIGLLIAWMQLRAGQEKASFLAMAVFLFCGVLAIFGSVFPTVMASTLNESWDLTIHNASSSPYTLKVMSVVAAVFVPIVLIYQGWTYWVFRKRISKQSIPAAHDVTVVHELSH